MSGRPHLPIAACGRAGALLVIAALLQAGCAARVESPAAADAVSVLSPQRSARGNPPFYEVFGKRYHVLDSSEGFTERGVASWYGPDFHRQPTSSGETYDMYAMTAAHKTLPLPTWVEVTNLGNGRRVIVKVNDRGPFVGDRIIDLSFSAAETLDMVRAGTALVEVRALGVPPGVHSMVGGTRPEREQGQRLDAAWKADLAVPPVAPVEPQRLFIQVGAFSDYTNARRLVDQLHDGGFGNAFIATNADADTLHRVRVGPLRDADEYDFVNAGLRRIGVGNARLVVD